MNLTIKIVFLLVFLTALISLIPGAVAALLSVALVNAFAPEEVKKDLQEFFESLEELF